MKICASCHIAKPKSEFHKNSRSKDGLHSYCRACNKAKTSKHLKSQKGIKYLQNYYKTDKGKKIIRNAVEKKRAQGYYRFGKGALPILKQGAKKRGITFSLSIGELEEWWKKTPDICYYCNTGIDEHKRLRDYILEYRGENFEIRKFKRFYRSSKHKRIDWLTLDRMNNELGYTIGNLVKSCWICNSLKSDFFTEKQMRIISPEIIKKLISEIQNETV
jgi:hypothetical protein